VTEGTSPEDSRQRRNHPNVDERVP